MNYTQRDDSSLVIRTNKRRSTALSCAECRRLKLKCSREFPCSNCVKKGCGPICPEGSLTTGKGNRFVLANTEVLHDKIGQLANRVRELEDALAKAHSYTSHLSHPLLSEDLLRIKHPLERERAEIQEEKLDSPDDIDALGSLSISENGRGAFFGRTANAWDLLQVAEGSGDEGETPYLAEEIIPAELLWLGQAFPFANGSGSNSDAVMQIVASLLPKGADARQLVHYYFRHAAWMYTPVLEVDFYNNIFDLVYTESPELSVSPLNGQNLAILCFVFAIGCLLDLSKPAQSLQAVQFYQLGRIALSLESVLDQPTIAGIQALLLMCHCLFLSDIGGPRWVIMGMVIKLAQSLGLHREGSKWNLHSEDTQKRRELFFEILTYDSWQSLTYGRPPSLSMAHIDSKMPQETYQGPTGEEEMSFAAWKHRFSYHCLSQVHDQAFGAKTPNYKTVRELDRKVREYYVPPSLQVPGFGTKAGSGLDQPSIELTMQRYVGFAIKEMTLFYMHRGFFAQALEDCPADPMGSKYAPSVLAAYTSACTFVNLVMSLFEQQKVLTERMWFLFTHVFSCAIVLGSIAIKPEMRLAPSALKHLESAYALFSRVSDKGKTSKILPRLARLRDRAHAALNAGSITSPQLDYTNVCIKSENDELSVLGGMTRLHSRRGNPSSPSSYSTLSPSPQPLSPSPAVALPNYASMQTQPWPNYGIESSRSAGYNTLHQPGFQETRNPLYMYSVPVQATVPAAVPEYFPEQLWNMPMNCESEPGNASPADLNESWANFMAQYQ